MKEKVLKFNIKNSFFGKIAMEYLGIWVTHDGIKPVD